MSTAPKPAPEQDIDLDALLLELGQFGCYQKLVYLYLGIAIIFTSVYNVQYIFNAVPVEYRCKVPECESPPENFTAGSWRVFALPVATSDCWRHVPLGKTCSPASFANHTTRCYSWVYEDSHTFVAEFGLACQEWKRTLVGTIHNVGVFVAIPCTAIISDAFGRRFALIGTAVAPALFGMLRAFCYSYWLYLVLEFLEAFVGNGTYSTAFIIALEIVSLKKRVVGGNIMQCTYALGQIVAGLTAWAMPYWRTYTLVIFAPSFLFVFYYIFVEESVRWLLAKGKRDQAVRIILKIARVNKIQKPILVPDKRKEVPIYKQVLKSKTIMLRMVIVSFWWVSVTMIYYGLSINSVSLKGNKYINFMLTALVEIPGSLLAYATLDRFGRKSSIMISFFICGISLLVLPAIKNQSLMIALTLLGKMMISLIFCGIYIYTIELFPTQARHVLMGFCSMTGRIGSMSAPQTPLLMKYMTSLPYILFGSMAGIAGMLMLLTPETLHMKLPDTIKQAEQMNATRTNRPTNLIA